MNTQKKIGLAMMIVFGLGAIIMISYIVKINTSTPAPTTTKPVVHTTDAKNTTYNIDNESVTLVNGSAERVVSPGSVSKQSTKYFGNELKTDLNGDKIDDVATLLTRDDGGSGLFYYVAVALGTANGYQGTNALLLGDRIAPQTINFINNEIVVNYADRKPDEPFTTAPSEGVSRYYKISDGKLAEIIKDEPKNDETKATSTCPKYIDCMPGPDRKECKVPVGCEGVTQIAW